MGIKAAAILSASFAGAALALLWYAASAAGL